MKTIVIAGGTGLIGGNLEAFLQKSGHTVLILTRNPRKDNHVAWNPDQKTIDLERMKGVEVIINLCGAGIADKRWTKKRKAELLSSRVKPAEFIHEISKNLPSLKHYVTASGITCYGFNQREEPYREEDSFGQDYLSTLVKQWEDAADQLASTIPVVTKLRIAVVFDPNGGALEKLMKPIKLRFGAALGSGKQIMSWIHIDDLARLFLFVIEGEHNGIFNAVGGNHSNAEITKALAKNLGRKIWLPNVPSFLLKLILGEMSQVLLNGVNVSNKSITELGFEFLHTELEEAIAF